MTFTVDLDSGAYLLCKGGKLRKIGGKYTDLNSTFTIQIEKFENDGQVDWVAYLKQRNGLKKMAKLKQGMPVSYTRSPKKFTLLDVATVKSI